MKLGERVIWKYQLAANAYSVKDEVHLQIPEGFTLLSVAVRDGALCLWAQVDPSRPLVGKLIQIVGTGDPFKIPIRFLGTVVMKPFVWHVFEGAGP